MEIDGEGREGVGKMREEDTNGHRTQREREEALAMDRMEGRSIGHKTNDCNTILRRLVRGWGSAGEWI